MFRCGHHHRALERRVPAELETGQYGERKILLRARGVNVDARGLRKLFAQLWHDVGEGVERDLQAAACAGAQQRPFVTHHQAPAALAPRQGAAFGNDRVRV